MADSAPVMQNVPFGQAASPEQLNKMIALPAEPPEDRLPQFNPVAGRTSGVPTAKSIEDVLIDLPTATKADTQSDDPMQQLRAQLAALQSELQDIVKQESGAQADGGAPEYVFESDDLSLTTVLTLPDKSVVTLSFRKGTTVRAGRLVQIGQWRSSWLPFEILSDRAKVEAIVETLKRTDDYRFGTVREQKAANARDLAHEIGKLRATMKVTAAGTIPASRPPDRHFDDSLRAVPQIAQSPSLPSR